MKNLFTVYNAFALQHGPDDCGIACLRMLLNFTGRYNDGLELARTCLVPSGGLSLLDLRELAAGHQIRSRCVRMDLAALRELRTPCVLHTQNANGTLHFVVCFKADCHRSRWRYLIGDPATGITWFPQDRLEMIWQNGAALVTAGLEIKPVSPGRHVWSTLFRALEFRKVLFVTVPALNVGATALGISLSWLLQRGINHDLTRGQGGFAVAIIVLLCATMLAKSLANHLKQQVLITLNAQLRRRYLGGLFDHFSERSFDERSLKKGFSDIQKIQNAAAALIGILFSEGLLAVLVVSAMLYLDLIPGIICILYALGMIAAGVWNSARIAWHQGEFAERSAWSERALLDPGPGALQAPGPLNAPLSGQLELTGFASNIATSISRDQLSYEFAGTITVVLILALCLYQVAQGMISYNMLMTEVVAAYFLTMLMPRICQSFPVITDGARLSTRFGNH